MHELRRFWPGTKASQGLAAQIDASDQILKRKPGAGRNADTTGRRRSFSIVSQVEVGAICVRGIRGK